MSYLSHLSCLSLANAVEILLCISLMYARLIVHIGYEPAGLTVHPPPQNDRGWVHFFRMGV